MQSPHGPRTPRITVATRLLTLVGAMYGVYTLCDTAAGPQLEQEHRDTREKKDRSGFTNTMEGDKGGSPEAPQVARGRCRIPRVGASLRMSLQPWTPQTQWTKRKDIHKKKVEKTNKQTQYTNKRVRHELWFLFPSSVFFFWGSNENRGLWFPVGGVFGFCFFSKKPRAEAKSFKTISQDS